MLTHAFIFDLSGTLVDPGNSIPRKAFKESFKEVGIHNLSDTQIMQDIGMAKRIHIRNMLSLYLDRDQITSDMVENICKSFNEKVEQGIMDGKQRIIQPAILRDIVTLARIERIPIGITSGYDRILVNLCMEQLQLGVNLNALSVASDEVKNGRPSGDMIEKLKRYWNVDKNTTLIKIGDTPVDVAEGKNAGCLTIRTVLSGYPRKMHKSLMHTVKRSTPIQMQPNYFARDLKDVLKILIRIVNVRK